MVGWYEYIDMKEYQLNWKEIVNWGLKYTGAYLSDTFITSTGLYVAMYISDLLIFRISFSGASDSLQPR